MNVSNAWEPSRYAHNASFVPAFGVGVLDCAKVSAGARVLDLGCGDGVLTRELEARGAVVVGVDASASMVAAACARGVDARVMDGQALDERALAADGPFDGVFSNAALHWMPDLDAVLAGVRRQLRPGGWFVGECGGRGCAAAVLTAVRASLRKYDAPTAEVMPWTFHDPERFRARLESAGFLVERVEWFPRLTKVPTGVRGWLETFGTALLAPLDEPTRQLVFGEVESLLRPSLACDDGSWFVDYVRLRFVATLAA